MNKLDLLIARKKLFFEKVDSIHFDYCWIWRGHKNKFGYGIFEFRFENIRYRYLAHRASYELNHGKIQKGLLVCHKCDNPECINPNHLFLGDDNDNTKDKVLKGRQYRKLNWDQVNLIREQYLNNNRINLSNLAKQFNIGRDHVRNILDGEFWKDENYIPPKKTIDIYKSRSLSIDKAIELKKAINNRGKTTLSQIAIKFNVKISLVCDISSERSYKDIIV